MMQKDSKTNIFSVNRAPRTLAGLAAAWMTATLLALSIVVPIQAQEATDDAKKKAMAEMMELMQERTMQATSTGDQHKALAQFLGEWDVELAMVMPGVPEQSAPGTATYEWIIEDRWLSSRIKGSFLGMAYESFSIIGFDSYAKNHVVAVVNSMDTAMLVARGVVVDPEGKSTAVYGTLDEYTTGDLKKPFKAVTHIQDNDHHVLEIWDLGIGHTGAKVIEFRFSRKK
jgi:hypothetical protein